MNKFDLWNNQKKDLHVQTGEAIFFEREVWLASLGKNIGVEMNGKNEQFLRPALIFKKYNRQQCLIFPLTTKGRNSKFYYQLPKVGFLAEGSSLALSQSRVFDQKRLFRKLGKISVGQFDAIKKSARVLLEPQSPRWL